MPITVYDVMGFRVQRHVEASPQSILEHCLPSAALQKHFHINFQVPPPSSSGQPLIYLLYQLITYSGILRCMGLYNVLLCGRLPSCGKMVSRLSHPAEFCCLDTTSFIYLFTSLLVLILGCLWVHTDTAAMSIHAELSWRPAFISLSKSRIVGTYGPSLGSMARGLGSHWSSCLEYVSVLYVASG